LDSYALRIATPIWSTPSPFHYLQLLPALAAVCFRTLQESLRKDSGRGARPLRILTGRIRHYARAHSSAHKRTRQGNSLHCYASLEAARIAAHAWQDPQPNIACSTEPSLRPLRPFSSAVLAAPLLRFQCLEPKEVRRETSVHAYESAEEETSRSSERLALEQFFVLRKKGFRLGPHRSRPLI
jgi:hypothetical protein